jgi:hypothetical protein
VVVVARSHVTRNKGEALALALNKFERLRCVTDGDPWTIARGMSNREVVTRAGAPVPWLSGPNCWYYRKARANTNIVGRTICFDRRGYVVDIDTALHL